jgi:hypothetical protein
MDPSFLCNQVAVPPSMLEAAEYHFYGALSQAASCESAAAGQVKLIPGKRELAGAIRYACSRWEALTCYCGDGRLEISNNRNAA